MAKNIRSSIKHWIFVIFGILLSLFLIFIYTYNLPNNPVGFFCDEALTGLVSLKFIKEFPNISGVFYNNSPFFYEHFGYTLGTLPIYTTTPFVYLFGLNEFAVRVTSVFFMLLTFPLLFAVFKKIRIQKGSLAILLFALTPIVIHYSRINWGQIPSIFFIFLGYYFYIRSKEHTAWLVWAILSGLSFGINFYGYLGTYIAIPIFLFILFIIEVVIHRFHFKNYRQIITIGITICICLLPIFFIARNNPDFYKRLKEKSASQLNFLSTEKIKNVIKNYPKYYSLDYLFKIGENGLPGSFITRHTVNGAGPLLPITLPLLVASFILIVFKTQAKKKYIVPFLLLAFVYPAPDVFFTRVNYPPYTVAVFTNILLVPILSGYTIHVLRSISFGKRVNRIISFLVAVLAGIIVFQGLMFYFITYQNYPKLSYDYWGWQGGAREIIGYFKAHADTYDEFYMADKFSQSPALLDFYLTDPALRKKADIGGLVSRNILKKQLFGIPKEEFNKLTKEDNYTIRHVVKDPSGANAFYIIDFL